MKIWVSETYYIGKYVFGTNNFTLRYQEFDLTNDIYTSGQYFAK